MQLNELVSAYVYADIRMTSEYDGNRGWIQLTNLFLKMLERKHLFKLGKLIETAVEVENSYWITMPSNCRPVAIDRIYYPPALISKADYRYSFETVKGKIKLNAEFPVANDDDPDTFTLSAGSTTQISINDADATADLWNDYLLVLTDGTYSGDTIIIGDTAAAGAGVSVLDFLHTQDNIINSTAGYLTKQYLMLKYYETYTEMAALDDEVPIDDNYEYLLGFYLIWQGMTLGDKRRKTAYEEFKLNFSEVEDEQFTPSPEQARAVPRELTGYVDANDFDDSEYIGDD
jgi:hypothetical protein